jgi:addiction module HigA family antidote
LTFIKTQPASRSNSRSILPTMVIEAPAPLPTPAGVRQRVPVHPGRFLDRHYLKPLGLTQTEAARQLGVSRRRINELVQGKRAMSPDTAIRCAQAFGLPAASWLAMQADWDAWQTWHAWKAQGSAPAVPFGASR